MDFKLFAEYRDSPYLSSTEKLVMAMLISRINNLKADHGDRESNLVWPSMATLAKDCSLSQRSVISTVKALVEKGALLKLGLHNSGGKTPSYLATYEYQVQGVDKIKTCAKCIHGGWSGWVNNGKPICSLNPAGKYRGSNHCHNFLSGNDYEKIRGGLTCDKCRYVLFNMKGAYVCTKQERFEVDYMGRCKFR